ncbi:MAG TPA: saccharopine dehydrogenase NADP-binding domain-containing protein [Kofleriaceae bacterium]|nr:saccharopine dehydrogenase NADP-binding domain-containing protein [Kofleriaceae bacterium]
MTREFDLILFGATGFTGRLVAEYLQRSSGEAGEPRKLRWAIAGRSREKLDALGLGVPVIVGDALDAGAMRELARRTSVVCTTAGPFARYGNELVAACADAGTHYCDLTGEVQWMRRMIDAHHERAKQTGARIVHTCGFDSIPSDIGTWATQQAFIQRFGYPARKVTALFGEQSGGFSGGTVASALETARESTADVRVRALLANPYALDPDPEGPHPDAPDERSIGWERHLEMFTVPFVMAQVNTRVVRRGHALAGFPWGKEFVYREVMSTPRGARPRDGDRHPRRARRARVRVRPPGAARSAGAPRPQAGSGPVRRGAGARPLEAAAGRRGQRR